MSRFTTEFIERFMSRRIEAKEGCWVWTGSIDYKGYGAISFKAKLYKAHRIAWELFYGVAPPADKLVCHNCDTPSCVRPSHLFVGTPADNTADMMRKGRSYRGTPKRGTENGGSRATEDTVRRIRLLRAEGGTIKGIARMVGMSASQVSNIDSGKHWSWLS